MVPNVESVYGITSKVVTTTIGVNRSPRERIFLQKSNSSSWLLRNFGFKIRNYHKNCRASKFKYPCQKAVWRVPRHSLVPGYKYLSWRTFWAVQLPTTTSYLYLWVLVVQSENQNLKSSLNPKSKCAVVSGIQKTKNSISSRMNSKLNLPIIILPMRVICSISSQESELSI